MKKELNVMEYKGECAYLLFAEQKSNAGETHYYTHSHPRHEIMFISEGAVEYVVENRRHELKKGDVLLVKPGLLHFAKSIITELERIASTDAEEPRKESERRWKRKRFINRGKSDKTQDTKLICKTK